MEYIMYKYKELPPDRATWYELQFQMLKMKLNNEYTNFDQYLHERNKIYLQIEREIVEYNAQFGKKIL